jgi:hypothetical protein
MAAGSSYLDPRACASASACSSAGHPPHRARCAYGLLLQRPVVACDLRPAASPVRRRRQPAGRRLAILRPSHIYLYSIASSRVWCGCAAERKKR